MRQLELTGQRFAHLVVIERGPTIDACVYWRCRCDCGTVLLLRGPSIKYGNTKSCGCLARKRKQKHGMHKSSEYTAWAAMGQRCTNPKAPNYANYGGRGITVCDRWIKSFEAFYADMGKKPTSLHSLDRIDNSRGYEPGNCRWATAKAQQRNTRHNRYLTLNGRTQLLCDWSSELGISSALISQRLRLGWSDERALSATKLRRVSVGKAPP